VDAVAIGQVTPGPVFTTATFLGTCCAGRWRGRRDDWDISSGVPPGGRQRALVPYIRRSATAGAFLDGVNVASLALMAAVSYQLGRAAIVDWVTVAWPSLAQFAAEVRINSAWLVLEGRSLALLRSSSVESKWFFGRRVRLSRFIRSRAEPEAI